MKFTKLFSLILAFLICAPLLASCGTGLGFEWEDSTDRDSVDISSNLDDDNEDEYEDKDEEENINTSHVYDTSEHEEITTEEELGSSNDTTTDGETTPSEKVSFEEEITSVEETTSFEEETTSTVEETTSIEEETTSTVEETTSVEEETTSTSEETTSVEEETTSTVEETTSVEEETSTEEEETTTEIVIPEASGYINPVFSVSGGVYTQSQTVSLSLPQNVSGDYTIYYSTDGSVPTKSYSNRYVSPITVSGTKVIRAICYKSGEYTPAGKVITNSYIMVSNTASTLWTVSITANPSELSGIVTNFNQSLEIPSHTEIITPSGETVISQDTGIKMFGGSSRTLQQKSFKVIARKDSKITNDITSNDPNITNGVYTGKGSFSYPLFADRTIRSGVGAGGQLKKYDSFILRNGGNDSLQATAADPTASSMVRDHLSNRFAKYVTESFTNSFDYANSQFAAVYVNGEYYGILDMREEMDDDYVKNVYGVDDDLVAIVKSELDTGRKCSRHANGSDCRYCNTWFYYETDPEFQTQLNEWLSLCQGAINGTKTYEEISRKIDLDSFAEYVAINLYLCNTDWPHNNVKIWKYTGSAIDGIEITDGKWRFMYRDMDFTFGRYVVAKTDSSVPAELYTDYDANTFYRILGNYQPSINDPQGVKNQLYPDSLYLQGLFNFCMKNSDFRDNFVKICDKMTGVVATRKLGGYLTNAANTLRPEMQRHLERWSGTYAVGYTLSTWENNITKIQNFINHRATYFKSDLDAVLPLYQ